MKPLCGGGGGGASYYRGAPLRNLAVKLGKGTAIALLKWFWHAICSVWPNDHKGNLIILRKFVPIYETLPRGYGLAWRDWERHGAICYPIPLNWIISIMRAVWLWLKFPMWDSLKKNQSAKIKRLIGDETAHIRREEFARGWQAAFQKLNKELDGRNRDSR